MRIVCHSGLNVFLPAIKGRVAERSLRLSIRIRVAVGSGLGVGRIGIAIGGDSVRGERQYHITLGHGVTDGHAELADNTRHRRRDFHRRLVRLDHHETLLCLDHIAGRNEDLDNFCAFCPADIRHLDQLLCHFRSPQAPTRVSGWAYQRRCPTA